MSRRRFAIAMVLTLGMASVIRGADEPLSFERYRDEVEPILLNPRDGHGPGLSACVTCHVHNGTPLELEPLQEDGNGGVFWTEEQSRKNFEVVSQLVVPGRPEQSRLLRTPLAVSAGGASFHVGGKFFDSREDPEWQTMAAWVRDADSRPGGELAAPPVLDFGFFQSCVQRIFLDKRENLMECIHCHNEGERGFAQEIPEGRDFWNAQETRENFTLLRRYVEPGYPSRSRFLTHPLAPEGGGDHFHGGGRRWASQDDPEWQMLAAWVRGEDPACLDYR